VELVAYVEPARASRVEEHLGAAGNAPVEPGWEDAWRAFHRPVRVGPLWIGPPWERPPEEATSVVIDPGQAFGTGAHPTTRLCLELLLEEEERGAVLDLGCGSGVLAVAAARLGFEPVIGLDLEQAAVEAARANARANGVRIEVRRADVLADPLPPAGLALANLELEPVERLAGRALPRRLVVSGFLTGDAPRLPGWRLVTRRELEGWAAELLVAER
jgi:ribosomal protein L11 methyltransferase